MLASPAAKIPDRTDLMFEPKWDGFRCLVFRDGDEIILQSRSGKSLNRYFPEAVENLRKALPEQVVTDGELVVARGGRLDFDALSERIHPADSRVQLLSVETPAVYVTFDLLSLGDTVLLDAPYRARRSALAEVVEVGEGVHLTPVTDDPATAREWFTLFEGAGLDGVIGKPADGRYTPGKRSLYKYKHARTADCVVAGLRWHLNTEPGTSVGSLLLGLYDDHEVLHHVGVVGAFPVAQRAALATELTPLIQAEGHPWLTGDPADGRRLPGGTNRWRGTPQEWVPLRPERVVEVSYQHTEGAFPQRFRQNAQFARWRPDREPLSCRYDQLDIPVRYDLDAVLRGEVSHQQHT
jgi:ATP-dependent DNA ligase